MSTWALIAVKARAAGKGRLAGVLDVEQRARLVCSMLDRVLTVALDCAQLDAVALLSSEHGAIPRDVLQLADSGAGLNEEILRAIRGLPLRGAQRVAILPADLPLLRSEDIEALLNATDVSGLALAPDRHQRGTNAVCVTLPSAFRTQFGPESFARHLSVAAQLGITPAIVKLPGLAFDVDEPADLLRLSPEILACETQHA